MRHITIFLPPKALVHGALRHRLPVAPENPTEEALLSSVVGVDIAAKPWIKCPLRTMPVFCKISETFSLALLSALNTIRQDVKTPQALFSLLTYTLF